MSASPIGVTGPPSGALPRLSITGVVPLQWYAMSSPATCGKRPVAIAVLHAGLSPLSSAARSWAPVTVSITVALPNGSTANASP